MAFKMKGPMFFKSALKNYKDTTKYKAFKGGNEAGSTLKHRVDDNPEHRDRYGANHSDDWQTEKEHEEGKAIEDRKSVKAEDSKPLKQTILGALGRISLGNIGKTEGSMTAKGSKGNCPKGYSWVSAKKNKKGKIIKKGYCAQLA